VEEAVVMVVADERWVMSRRVGLLCIHREHLRELRRSQEEEEEEEEEGDEQDLGVPDLRRREQDSIAAPLISSLQTNRGRFLVGDF
jgi:hypothetical protein